MTDKEPTPKRASGRIAFVFVLAMLAGLVALTVGLLMAEFSRDADVASADRDGDGLVQVTVEPAWKRPAADALLTRIGVGSCLHQDHPMPIWDDVIAAKPDLFLMIGDNVYGDIRNGDPNELGETYIRQANLDPMIAARKAMPFLATWDDHDYGLNDGGAGYEFQPQAAHFFRAFWQLPEAKTDDGGIYYAKTYGPAGRRVQIIMLDTRSFRSPLTRKGDDFPHWGKYQPDDDATKTILGDAQWQWLADRLREPADVRILASSIQVLADGHGFERWGNFPGEAKRLKDLIVETDARGVVLVSGDRHAGAVYREGIGGDDARVLVELTASSLNRAFGPSKDTRMAPLVSDIVHQENFGLIDVDWQSREIRLSLHGIGDQQYVTHTVGFGDLGLPL